MMAFETITFDDADQMRAVVEAAETTRLDLAALPGGEGAKLDYVARAVAAVQVALAIWPDDGAPWGYSIIVLKGEPIVRAHQDRACIMPVAVIPCANAGQATALRLAYGDDGGTA